MRTVKRSFGKRYRIQDKSGGFLIETALIASFCIVIYSLEVVDFVMSKYTKPQRTVAGKYRVDTMEFGSLKCIVTDLS